MVHIAFHHVSVFRSGAWTGGRKPRQVVFGFPACKTRARARERPSCARASCPRCAAAQRGMCKLLTGDFFFDSPPSEDHRKWRTSGIRCFHQGKNLVLFHFIKRHVDLPSSFPGKKKLHEPFPAYLGVPRDISKPQHVQFFFLGKRHLIKSHRVHCTVM